MQTLHTPPPRPATRPPCTHAEALGLAYHHIDDADAQADSLRGWDQTYDQLSPGAYSGSTLDVNLGEVQVFREVFSKSLRQQGRAPGGTHGFVLGSGGDARYRGSVLTQEGLLSIEEGTEFDLCSPCDYTGFGVAVDVAALRHHAASRGGNLDERLAGPGHRDMVHAGTGQMGRFRHFLGTVFDQVTHHPALLAQEAVRRELCADIMDQLFEVLSATVPETTDTRTARRHARIVARAEEYVLAHAFESVTVEDLCGHVGASRRQLQYAFQDVIGQSPNRYLRALRLCRVRRELKAGLAAGDGIQDAAARWGFWHLGHFALDYRRMFDERPSDTLRQALAGGR